VHHNIIISGGGAAEVIAAAAKVSKSWRMPALMTEVRKTVLLVRFKCKNDHFTKTGSGQT
jgi:hypothetical protein